MMRHFGLCLHNAYGLTETQQVLTTVIDDTFTGPPEEVEMGKPIAGVILGLKHFDEDLYSLYVKSPFGHKSVLNENRNLAEEFFYTGDIVRYREPDHLTFIGREKNDFIKSGFGAKVSLNQLKKYYNELYQDATHIEYMAHETFNFSLGIAALIFLSDPSLPPGRITDKKTIQKFYHRIKTINKHLFCNLEPFEYDHWTITRFLLINHAVDLTFKGTISRFGIDTQFIKEKYDLTHSNNPKSGVKTMGYLSSGFLRFLMIYTPLRQRKIRKLLLRVFIH
jgi:hypothetical protein